jgi:hypothetical protein
MHQSWANLVRLKNVLQLLFKHLEVWNVRSTRRFRQNLVLCSKGPRGSGGGVFAFQWSFKSMYVWGWPHPRLGFDFLSWVLLLLGFCVDFFCIKKGSFFFFLYEGLNSGLHTWETRTTTRTMPKLFAFSLFFSSCLGRQKSIQDCDPPTEPSE